MRPGRECPPRREEHHREPPSGGSFLWIQNTALARFGVELEKQHSEADEVIQLFKSAAIWLLILGCAVLNGALREVVLVPHLGKPGALVLSGILLSACIVLVSLGSIRWLGRLGTSRALLVGLFWLCLTLAFEFGFGRLVQHRTWSELLEAYTFKDGNIWPLVLVVTLFAPLLAARLRGREESSRVPWS